MVREAGVEPARPEWTLEPESSESTNSTTRASLFVVSQRLVLYHPFSKIASLISMVFGGFLDENLHYVI